MTPLSYAQHIATVQRAILEAFGAAPSEDQPFWLRHYRQVENVRQVVAVRIQQEQQQQAAQVPDADQRLLDAIAARQAELQAQDAQGKDEVVKAAPEDAEADAVDEEEGIIL